MLTFIKKIIVKSYLFLFQDRILLWVRTYHISLLKSQLAYAGNNISIDLPYKIINPKFISVGDNFSTWHNCRIEAIDKYNNQLFSPKLKIGSNISIGPYFHMGCTNEIIIGDNVLIGSKVYITDHSHGNTNAKDFVLAPEKRDLFSKGPVIIEDNVWIGDAVCILPNVKIGKNAIIGANSVVTKDVAANTVVGGIPAKVIKIIDFD